MGTELRRRRRLSDLLGLASFACLGLGCLAWPAARAHAQQVTTPNGAVTIDYGVLNALGQGQAPGVMVYGQAYGRAPYPAYVQSPYSQSPYAPPVSPYGQPAYPYPYGQPAYGYPAQGAGQVLYPPPQYPVSSLLVPAPMGSTPYVPQVSAVQRTQPMTPPAATAPAATAMAPAPAPASTATATTTAPSTTAPSTTASASTDTGPQPPPPPSAVPGASTITAPPPPSTTTTTATAEAPSAPATSTTAPAASTDNSAAGSTASVTPPAPPPAEGSSGTAATGSGGIAPPAAADTSGGIAAPSAPAASGTSGTAGTANTQTAAIPPAAPVEGQIQIAFPTDSADIPDAAKAELDTVAQKMSADENLRLQLLAYASGTADEASRARRMSLSRALAVRSYLIKAGVRSTRMDVRALGNNVQGSPADRVDIIPKTT
jgi:outer membrane protein OmpA-like peptidoglycan-associated protein